MKKFFRFIGILLLVLIVGFLIICAIAPKEITVERSTSIKAPKQAVWDEMVYFHNWGDWSPWKEMDSTVHVDITGTDGTAGSSYHWLGKKSGEGYMTNASVTDGRMNYAMKFVKPFEATADGWVKVEDEGNGMTKASWGYHAKEGFFMAGMMKIMMMMGHGLEKSFDRGLELLKNHVENTPHTAGPDMSIQETQFPGHSYVGVRKTVAWDDLMKMFGETFGMLGQSLGARINGPASGLFYTWDTVKHQTDMAAAFPVTGKDAAKGAIVINVPASKAYMIAYHGPYGNMMGAHKMLGKHVMDNNEKMNMVIEEYVSGPSSEKDSTKWLTNIYYLVK